MKIVTHYPPNFSLIAKHFPIGPTSVITYGDLVCNLSGLSLPQHIIEHEKVHVRQQTDPEAWWKRFITDPEFRLEQELEAYRTQWKFIKTAVKKRHLRTQILVVLANQLSGPSYGKMISYSEAFKAIDL